MSLSDGRKDACTVEQGYAGGVCEMNSSRFLAFAWYGGSM
jgi:hypothetical protein